jgi:hypothetical protein
MSSIASCHFLHTSAIPGPLRNQADDLPDFGHPACDPDRIINEQGRGNINPIVDHFSTIPENVYFRLNTQLIEGFADVFQGAFAPVVAFGFAKYIYPHSFPFLPGQKPSSPEIITYPVTLL